MRVCVCVCVCVFVCAYVHVCVHACVHVRERRGVCTKARLSMPEHTHTCQYGFVYESSVVVQPSGQTEVK